MTDQTPAPAPIEVRADITPDAIWQTLRVVLIFAAGIAVEHFATSGVVIAAGVAAATAVVTYGLGMLKLLWTHRKLTRLTTLLPNSVARFK